MVAWEAGFKVELILFLPLPLMYLNLSYDLIEAAFEPHLVQQCVYCQHTQPPLLVEICCASAVIFSFTFSSSSSLRTPVACLWCSTTLGYPEGMQVPGYLTELVRTGFVAAFYLEVEDPVSEH